MAIGTMADFKIYDEQYFGGQYERLATNLAVFNEASRGAILLSNKNLKGKFEKQSFMKKVANLIVRRDPTDTGAAAAVKPTQGEFVGVKLSRGIGPADDTMDAWKKIAEDPELFSFYIGQMVAEQKLEDMVKLAVSAVETAIQGEAGLVVPDTTATITHLNLVQALAKMGDQSNRIIAWVMHSKPYHDLIGQAITDKIVDVANVAIYNGTVATLGRPTIVIDQPALTDAGPPVTFNTLGLVAGAVEVTESEPETVVFDRVTGLKNLVMRLQGEYAVNLKVKGKKWNTAIENPTDAEVATAANWVKEATEDKDLSGVRLVTR